MVVIDTILEWCEERVQKWEKGCGSEFYWEGRRDQYKDFVELLELIKKKIMEGKVG